MRFMLLTLGLCACSGGGEPGTLMLSWQLADGRRCVDAGAATVEVYVDDAKLASVACTLGTPPSAAPIDNTPREGSLTVRALSLQGTELYRNVQPIDATLLPLTVTLYATGAR